MKSFHFNFASFHLDVTLRFGSDKSIDIRKYDFLSKEVSPELKRELVSRIKARARLPL